MLGTETWLKPEISDGEVLLSQSFHLFRNDRTRSRGGGVLIAISKAMNASLITVDCDLEVLWVRLDHPSFPVIVGACYRPPGRDNTFVDKLYVCMEHVFSLFPGSTIIFGGDFNYPGVNWKGGIGLTSCAVGAEASNFINLMHSYGLAQIVNEPTRLHSVLDLVFTSSADDVRSVRILDRISDHNTVLVEMSLPLVTRKISPKLINVYSKVNECALNEAFKQFASEYEHHFYERSVESNWKLLKDEFKQLMSRFVPQIVLKTNADQPWFTNTLRKLTNKKSVSLPKLKKPTLYLICQST